MLVLARRRLPPEVVLREGWAEQLPFESGQFNVVVSCNVFHYIRQPAAALREMSRVLAPAGRLLLTDWSDDFLACRLCDLYLRLFQVISRSTSSGSFSACSAKPDTAMWRSTATRSVGSGA